MAEQNYLKQVPEIPDDNAPILRILLVFGIVLLILGLILVVLLSPILYGKEPFARLRFVNAIVGTNNLTSGAHIQGLFDFGLAVFLAIIGFMWTFFITRKNLNDKKKLKGLFS